VSNPERRSYNRLARHFDVESLPHLLKRHLPTGPLALADYGCGDGPLFHILHRLGYISPARPVYAVDLQEERLQRVSNRFPFITTVVPEAGTVPSIEAGTLDFVISTMLMEHVADEAGYLDELRRVLKPGGKLYLTTVFKRTWAWYFRRRDGRPVLDVSHLREYTDLEDFKGLVMEGNRFAALEALDLDLLWFPVLDPFLFLIARYGYLPRSVFLTRLARWIKLPIPGYYTLSVVLRA
jgi:SAM-dependent methyltransferase